MIKAPYNFVPLSDKVFFPPWAEQVSHDIPFSDGESGEIDITITAKSPIFIRDHKKQEEFCQDDKGNYYIPGSSVKGMIRNVLEIMSFSKIKIDPKHKKKTYVRDLTKNLDLHGKATGKTDDTTFGYGILELHDSGYTFIDYGNKIRLILQRELIQNSHLNYTSHTSTYEDVGQKYADVRPFTRVNVKPEHNPDKSNKYFDKYTMSFSEETQVNNGSLFFGGAFQGKHYEFILLDDDIVANGARLPSSVLDSFKQIYFEDNSSGNYVGNYWKNKHRIPVFYEKSNNTITALGLTQLFKKEYPYSIYSIVKNNISNGLDLTESIFGTTSDDRPSVKGRVHFSHFKAEDSSSIKTYGKYTTVLSSPKPSFYPVYLEQPCQDNGTLKDGENYQTLMKLSKIAGWKRYPLHHVTKDIPKASEEDDSSTTFTPIGCYQEGTQDEEKNTENFNEIKFHGILRYHNLNTFERGALLSALTFHGNTNSFYHNIGSGKMFGLGKIKVELDSSTYGNDLAMFEYMMNNFLDTEWLQTPQLKELLHMSYKDINIDNQLKYQKLIVGQENPNDNKNDFVAAKNDKKCLPKCSSMYELRENYPSSLVESNTLYREFDSMWKRYEVLRKQAEEYYAYLDAMNSHDLEKLKLFIHAATNPMFIKSVEKKYEELKKSVERDEKILRYKKAQSELKARIAEENIRNKQSGLEKFIRENKEFGDLILEAENELAKYNKPKTNKQVNEVDLKDIHDEETLVSFLKANKSNIDDLLDTLKPIIMDLFVKLNSKKNKSKFIKNIDKHSYKNFHKKVGLN